MIPNNTAWFEPKNLGTRVKEFPFKTRIEGGYLHAYGKMPYGGIPRINFPDRKLQHGQHCYFVAYAFDVVATGTFGDIVCKKLYIPAFDTTSELTAQYLKDNNIVLPS